MPTGDQLSPHAHRHNRVILTRVVLSLQLITGFTEFGGQVSFYKVQGKGRPSTEHLQDLLLQLIVLV